MKKIASLLVALCFGLGATVAFAQDAPPKDAPKGEHSKRDPMKPMDCSKAPADMKDRCEARNKALEACKDKKDEEHKKCMMDQRPKKADK
jgi:hypothetical protein